MSIDTMLYIAAIMMYIIIVFLFYIMWKLLQSILMDIEEGRKDAEDE
jgi:hypothetical protein